MNDGGSGFLDRLKKGFDEEIPSGFGVEVTPVESAVLSMLYKNGGEMTFKHLCNETAYRTRDMKNGTRRISRQMMYLAIHGQIDYMTGDYTHDGLLRMGLVEKETRGKETVIKLTWMGDQLMEVRAWLFKDYNERIFKELSERFRSRGKPL